jgi:SAM-dependent methyltransferase
MMEAAVPTFLMDLLRCPSCGSPFTPSEGEPESHALECSTCRRRVPVVGGVPRFVQELDETAQRTQASFGYEWTHFKDWRYSGETNFNDYFQGFELASLAGGLVLDAGCGMGRHARQMAPFARRVVAVDFSRAIDQAARNTAECQNVDCMQADILTLPLADGSFDFVYSLGVLHHLSETERALAGLVRKLKPGGHMRIYLYWKRHGWAGFLLRGVTLSRRVTTRLPFPLLRGLCRIVSVALYGGVVVPYRLLSRVGVRRHESWPLFVYTKYSFHVLYNDQFDRFSAPLEKRYEADEVRDLLLAAGLTDVRVLPCYGWVADGRKPL